MTLQIEKDLSSLLEDAGRSAEQTAREFIVVELYRQARISGGKAAELLGMRRMQFIERAAELGIPWFDLSPGELDEEFEAVRKLGR